MRGGVTQILGKTISGVIHRDRGHHGPPRTQLFLLFRDGTQLELRSDHAFTCGATLSQGDWRGSLRELPACDVTECLLELSPAETPEGVPEPRWLGYGPNPHLIDFVGEMGGLGILRERSRLSFAGKGGREYSIPYLVPRYEPVKLRLGPSGLRLIEGGSA
jgi:hypothetical protein